MKKLLLLLLVTGLLLASCATGKTGGADTSGKTTSGETTAEETKSPVESVNEMTLSDIMEKIIDSVEDMPEVWDLELNAENFPNYAFVDYKDGYEGLCSEAMMNITTHSVVLVRVPDGEDAAAVAKHIKDNANPNKWVCVSADKVVVRQYGNTIALVMSYTQIANQVISNFDKLNGAETPVEDRYVPQETTAAK